MQGHENNATFLFLPMIGTSLKILVFFPMTNGTVKVGSACGTFLQGISDQFDFLGKCLRQNCRELSRIHATVIQNEKDKVKGYCFKCARLQIERSGFETWPWTLLCVHGQPCDEPASHPGGSRNMPSRFMLQNREKLRPDGPLGSYEDFTIPSRLVNATHALNLIFLYRIQV